MSVPFSQLKATWVNKVWGRIKQEFHLDTVEPHNFFCSEWEINPNAEEQRRAPSISYLIYRGTFMLILLTAITFSTTCQSYLFHLFLTNWSFLSQNIYATLLFASVFWRWWEFNCRADPNSATTPSTFLLNQQDSIILELGNPDKRNSNQPDVVEPKIPTETVSVAAAEPAQLCLNILEKAIWILINVVHVLPYCVVLGYWCFVYKYDPDQASCERFRSHFIVHGATAVLAFIDALIISIPVRQTHFLIPMGLVLFYVVFTGLYEMGGGVYRPGKQFIYSILDWKNNPRKAFLFSSLAVIVTPLAHTAFCWGIYKLRLWLKTQYLKVKASKLQVQNTSQNSG